MPFLNRMFIWTMNVFVFITVVLPSGNIHGINFKLPLYVCLFPLAVYSLFRAGMASPSRLALLSGVPGLLSIWIIVGIVRGFPLAGVIRQYMDVFVTMTMCWFASIYVAEEEAGRLRFLRMVVNAEVMAAVFKTGLIAYAMVRGIPTVEIVNAISDIFGVRPITMDTGALFGRVQFFSDVLIPIGTFIVLRYRDRLRIGVLRASISILLLLASVVFSFSRYLWAFTAVALVLGIVLGKRDRFQLVLAGMLTATVLASLPSLTALYALRFSSEVAGGSDQLRTEQSKALKDFYDNAPILGHGFGSYSTQVIREGEGGANVADNYGYEEQLFALCGQIGLTGMTVLVGLALFYYSDLWWRGRLGMGDRLGVSLLLLFWIASGFYNPLLFQPIAGVNYATLAALAGLSRWSTADGPARNLSETELSLATAPF